MYMVKVSVRNQNGIATGDLEAGRMSRVSRKPGVTNDRFPTGQNQLKSAMTEPRNFYRHGQDYCTDWLAKNRPHTPSSTTS